MSLPRRPTWTAARIDPWHDHREGSLGVFTRSVTLYSHPVLSICTLIDIDLARQPNGYCPASYEGHESPWSKMC